MNGRNGFRLFGYGLTVSENARKPESHVTMGFQPPASALIHAKRVSRGRGEARERYAVFASQGKNVMSGLCDDELAGDSIRRKAPAFLRASFHEEMALKYG